MSANDALLTEITENFNYYVASWREIREEGRIDMRFISGDSWDPADRKFREANKRPCLSVDELNQYVNSTVNDVRQNKRAVKVSPLGNGATDDTAYWRAGIIRQIEYQSKAQTAYLTAFQSAVERSYGCWKIVREYEPKSMNQRLVVKRTPNPDTVLFDPDALELDVSDGMGLFEITSMPWSRFRMRWPDAQITSFSTEVFQQALQWGKDDRVQVASYWKVKTKKRTLVLFENGASDYLDKIPGAKLDKQGFCCLPDGARLKVDSHRPEEDRTIVQYMTNGVEILETNPQPGKYIPYIPVYGKEIYVDDGSGSKRIILSLTRLARDAQTLYAYTRSCQQELIGMAPKIPIIGYEGQFDTATDWENINRVPHAYAEVKARATGTGDTMLPLPQFQNWEPPIQAAELLAESARRAIQAAMGKYNTSVGKHDTAAQSGVAVKALDQQADTGSYHLIDNYDVALAHNGRIMDDLLDPTYGNQREVGIRGPDEKHSVLKINQPTFHPKTKAAMQFNTSDGDHEATIGTGPSMQSQRDEANQFCDTLAQNPVVMPRIGDLVVKLRDLGPIGDEIAERLEPPDVKAQREGGQNQIPPQITAQLHAQDTIIKQLQAEKAADALAQGTKRYCADVQGRTAIAVQLAKSGQAMAADKMWAELESIDARWQMEQDTIQNQAAATGAANAQANTEAAAQAAANPPAPPAA